MCIRLLREGDFFSSSNWSVHKQRPFPPNEKLDKGDDKDDDFHQDMYPLLESDSIPGGGRWWVPELPPPAGTHLDPGPRMRPAHQLRPYRLDGPRGHSSTVLRLPGDRNICLRDLRSASHRIVYCLCFLAIFLEFINVWMCAGSINTLLGTQSHQLKLLSDWVTFAVFASTVHCLPGSPIWSPKFKFPIQLGSSSWDCGLTTLTLRIRLYWLESCSSSNLPWIEQFQNKSTLNIQINTWSATVSCLRKF